MADATGETDKPVRVAFDRRIKLQFHGAQITSDGGLLAYRELDDAFGLTAMGASALGEGRRGRNFRHHLPGLLRQAVYGRLAGYEDVNDAERLARDPAMRAIVGREGIDRPAASTSEMGRFETEWLATETNLAALADLSGAWIDRVHERRPPDGIILDLDSSESPTHGEQEGSAWNGHFRCACYHPLFLFNQFGDLERCLLRPGNVHSAEGVAPGARAGDRPLPRPRLRPLLPWRRGVRQARAVRAARGGGHRLRHPAPGQPGAAGADQAPADPTCGSPAEEAAGVPRQLQLPGRELVEAAAGGGPRRVAPGRALPAGRLHRHQPEEAGRAGHQVLRRSGHGGAVDQRGEARPALDAAVLPRLPGQRGPAATVRARLQPGQLPAFARLAERGGAVVADDLAREAGEDRRLRSSAPKRAPRPLRRLPAGRGGGATRPVRRDPAPDRPLARTARSGLTRADYGMAEAEGRTWAEGGSAARERFADRPLA